MPVSTITAGQKDWLKVLNSNDQANHLTVIKTTATLINGWSGVINLYRIDGDGFRLYATDGYINVPSGQTLNRGVTAKVATFTDSFDGMKGLAFPVSGYVVTGSMMFQSDGTITATGGLENLGAGVTISFATSIFK